ncbi:hypothetical protein [Variovorax rhizosphaerae]|uniref:Integrase catalytic domain-containing protein n=1 Tax=Variovorax rhizosphaerae TaxID=1836200 RepID=A0ABU8X076_9BURK
MRRSATRELRLEELDLVRAAAPDVSLLSPDLRARYDRLRAALELYWQGTKPKEIARLYGVSRQMLDYCEARFFLQHEDGRPYGFRALVRGTRIHRFKRERESNAQTIVDGFGAAGSFRQCLAAYPRAKKVLDQEISQHEGESPESIALSHVLVHRKFLEALRANGVAATQYPFCTTTMAYESVRTYVLSEIRARHSKNARTRLFGHAANDGLDGRSGRRGWLEPQLPCDVACYDEQLLPAIATVAFEFGGERRVVPMERLSLCVLVSLRPKCVLAYHLSHRSRVSSADFLESFNQLLTPWKPQAFKAVPRLTYKCGAGFPNGVVPGFLDGLRIGLLRIDNDLTHYADAVLVYLRDLVGATIEFGQVRRWITRAAVEQVFGELEREISKLPSTTGSGPDDRHVSNPGLNAVKWEITIDELRELLEVIIANLNGRPRTELYGASPLEAVARDWAKRDGQGAAIPGYAPTVLAEVPLPVGICKVVVRGNERKGEPPYIELDHARYSSDLLRCGWHLIGSPMIALLQKDHRLIKLRYPDGSALGAVQVTGHWARSFHDRATRQEIIRLRKQRALEYGGLDDPVEAFKAHKLEQMAAHARKRPGNVMRGSNKYIPTVGDGTAELTQPRAHARGSARVPEASTTWTQARLAAQRKVQR